MLLILGVLARIPMLGEVVGVLALFLGVGALIQQVLRVSAPAY